MEANALSLVRFDRNDYSVPVAWAHHKLTAVGDVQRLAAHRLDARDRPCVAVDRSVKVEDREDAVQAVFEQLWKGRKSYGGTGPLLAYLTICARHRLTDQLRQRRARQSREAAAGSTATGNERACKLDPHAVLWAYERAEGVQQAVRKLPVDQRQVVELVYFGGRSHDEAAVFLCVSRRTVKRRCSAALEAMERALVGLLPER